MDITSKYYPISFDPALVRGMGYYTGPIFEIVSEEFKGSIAGGGRYDNLLNKFQDIPIPAVGFSIGFERIIAILKERNFEIPNRQIKIALIVLETEFMEKAVQFSNRLIEQGNIVSIYYFNKNKIGKRVKSLENNGYTNIQIIDKDITINNFVDRLS